MLESGFYSIVETVNGDFIILLYDKFKIGVHYMELENVSNDKNEARELLRLHIKELKKAGLSND